MLSVAFLIKLLVTLEMDIYSKYSLNGPEIAATAIGVYYAAPVVVPAITAFLSSLGGAVPLPTG